MEPSTATAKVVRFGIFELDAESGELRRHGLKIRLPEQSFQILRLLIARPGEVVTREELRQQLWTPDTFVDFDVGMNSAIRKLREALDDSAENPRFVETLPRRGYRFIAPMKPLRPNPVPGSVASGTIVSSQFRRPWIAGGFVVAVAVAGLFLIYERGWDRLGEGPGAAPIRSLAVLPFENLTGDTAQDYVGDGMTDALTTDLAQIAGLQVISRTSAMQYKGAKKPVPVIAKELNVDALVDGAITRSGQQFRITAQLIHGATDRHLWAQRYDGEMRDALSLQKQMAEAIAAAIGRPLAPTGGAQRPRDINPAAYDAYLKGVSRGGQGSYEGFRTAVAYFEEAVAIQPDFAAAHAALAQAQLQFLFAGPHSPRETMPKAAAAARRALELDETLAQAHRTLGTILHHYFWDWEAGDKEFARARELSSSSAESNPAGAAALIRSGRFEDAIALTERARITDPLSFNAHMNVATAYRAAGQYDRAVTEIRRALELNSRHPRANFQLGVTFMFMGRVNDAVNELEATVKSGPANPRFQAYLGYAYAAAGRPLDARRILRELEARARQQYVSSFGIALIYDALGEKAPSLAALERAYQDRAVEFAQMTQYPRFKTVASDPRYEAVMRSIALPH